eukprot:tig00000841_g4735.t1
MSAPADESAQASAEAMQRHLQPEPPAGELTCEKALAAVRKIMEISGWAFLNTVRAEADGGPPACASRMVHPSPPDEMFRVYIGCHSQSRKLDEIRANPNASLSYMDKENWAYVTLMGKARVVEDEPTLRQFWREEYRVFYPGGPLGPEFALLEVVPGGLEVVARSMGVPPDVRVRPLLLRRGPAAGPAGGASWSLELSF